MAKNRTFRTKFKLNWGKNKGVKRQILYEISAFIFVRNVPFYILYETSCVRIVVLRNHSIPSNNEIYCLIFSQLS